MYEHRRYALSFFIFLVALTVIVAPSKQKRFMISWEQDGYCVFDNVTQYELKKIERISKYRLTEESRK